jgi:RNA polymerase sigma factor (sigma-70 family)
MEQEIRFIRVEDTRIGAATVGDGPPLVLACWWIGHLEAQWEHPPFRSFVEELARERTVIRYDRPATGLSDPLRADDDLAAETAVLDGVIGAMAGGRAAVLGASCGACASVALAATRPARVERLVLYGGYADGTSITTPAVRASLESLVRAHWGLGAMTLADVFMPESDAATREDFARFQRRAATPDEAAEYLRLVYRLDAAHDGPLSEREREVLGLVAAGLSDADIAEQLVLSPHTVHRHVANVRRKLQQPSRAAAVAEAARLGLI